ncbi:MAG TPA: amino acid permease, partial [Anaerolineae bacterium]|nr:amino acid permease [Anaerolineae bacterium]
CSLYAVLFGTFLSELMKMAGVSWGQEPILFGLTGEVLAVKVLAVLAALAFIFLNTRGASETGMVGNIVTIFKVLVLLTLVGFGLRAMVNMPNWVDNFLADPSPLPNGIRGVVLAMGLTFIAFEGYEIIAQSGEEVKQPERNVPRAIFLAIAIVVLIYLLVAFVSVGALVQNSGEPNWVYLGRYGERAMIWTAKAIMPYGAVIIILGGLASTMSALNATIYSSSRVSFAMGRERDLPAIFGRIHRHNKTPHWAIWLSGLLIIFMAVLLPIEDVAAGASITFLLLFLTVNLTLVRLRKAKPGLPRPFQAPLVPWLQYFAIAIQLALALTLSQLSLVAWEATIAWLLLGVVVYRQYGAVVEANRNADTILLEETIATREYSVMLPVASESEARQLARLGALLAKANDGELFALHVVRVPQQVGLSDGRAFLRQGRPILEEVISIGQQHDVPVHTMLRLGRDISESIISAARERDANLILLGWPGYTSSRNRAFGSIVDLISKTPPCDLAVVRFRRAGVPRRILVPTAGGANSHLALQLAVSEADAIEQRDGTFPEIIVLHLMPAGADAKTLEERRLALLKALEIGDLPIELQVKS